MLMTSSVDFPGLAKLRQMGQRMSMMRRGGMQGSPDNPMGSIIPPFNPMTNAPQNQPGGVILGGGEAGQAETEQVAAAQPGMVPETPNPEQDLMPRQISPPAISQTRDQMPPKRYFGAPDASRQLGTYRNAGIRSAGRKGLGL